MAIPNIRTHISLLMRYRSLENEYAKLDLGLLLKPHSMTKIRNISSSGTCIYFCHRQHWKNCPTFYYMTYLIFLNTGSFMFLCLKLQMIM